MQVPLPLFPRRLRWAGVLVIAGFILYSSLLTVPETVVDDTQPDSTFLRWSLLPQGATNGSE